MEKFCDFITNPDWWSVILSAISTIAVITIAVIQIRMQRQQLKAQEYDTYKTMFSVVEETNDVAQRLLGFIYTYFSSSSARVLNENTLAYMQDNIKSIQKRLKDSIADFKLKFKRGVLHTELYIGFLDEMHLILQLFIFMESHSDIVLIEAENDSKIAIDYILEEIDDMIIIDAIQERIQNEIYSESMKERMIKFSNHTKRILKLDIASKIRECC